MRGGRSKAAPRPPRPGLKQTAHLGGALGDILKSEPAQRTLHTVTEAATKAAIASFVS